MFPDKFKSRLVTVPTMAHLTKLLSRLPLLVASGAWSSRWFLDLPLCCVVSRGDGKLVSVDPSALPMRYLLSDMVSWIPHRGIITSTGKHIKASLVRQVYDGLTTFFFGSPSLVLTPVIRSMVAFNADEAASLGVSSGVSSWLPSSVHWQVPTTSKTSSSVSTLSLGALRRFWHVDQALILSNPRCWSSLHRLYYS
jgi:hypothetical protein